MFRDTLYQCRGQQHACFAEIERAFIGHDRIFISFTQMNGPLATEAALIAITLESQSIKERVLLFSNHSFPTECPQQRPVTDVHGNAHLPIIQPLQALQTWHGAA